MAESIKEIFKRKLVPVRFERSMGLLGATTLGIGALMGAGIYVLIGLAAEKAGQAVGPFGERSGEFDLLVVGATKVRFLEKAAVGPFSSQIASRSDCSVAIVRVATAVKKIMPI